MCIKVRQMQDAMSVVYDVQREQRMKTGRVRGTDDVSQRGDSL